MRIETVKRSPVDRHLAQTTLGGAGGIRFAEVINAAER
jgi:hypothetical protein